jgi:hypothetical protein
MLPTFLVPIFALAACIVMAEHKVAAASAGDPIPGVDVGLEQVPGGIVANGGGAPAGGSKCDGGLTKATIGKVACVGKAVAKAQGKGVNVTHESLQKCQAKYDGKVLKAQVAGNCFMQTESAAPMDVQVNQCVRAMVGPAVGACAGGGNSGLACQYDDDCPSGTCSPPVTGCSSAVFSDAGFADANWDSTVFLYGGSYPANGSMTDSQDLVNGCSAPSREVAIHVAAAGAAGSGVFGVSIHNGAAYNPSAQGSITSFDYDESNASILGHQGTGAALQQGSNLYVLEQPLPVTTDSATCAATSVTAITASQMCLVLPSGSNPLTYGPYLDCTQHPDFSCTGSKITFGFVRGNSAPPNGGAYDTSVTADNWRVAVCGAPCS